MKIPVKLNKPTIKEACLELRYESELPLPVLCGAIYNILEKIKEENQQIQSLNDNQIPDYIRENDPNFRYSPRYRIVSEKNFTVAMGTHVIIFSILDNYPGWKAWKESFENVIKEVSNIGFIKSVTRIGLRYIDYLTGNVIDKLNIKAEVCSEAIQKDSPVSLYTMFEKENNKINLNVNNFSLKQNNNEPITLVDIDCYKEMNIEAKDFFGKENEIFEEMHNSNKEIFFGLLKQDLLESLEPSY